MKRYLFVLSDGSLKTVESSSFKDAVEKLALYLDDYTLLFQKAMKGFEESDILGVIELFDHFASKTIDEVFTISETVFSKRDEEYTSITIKS